MPHSPQGPQFGPDGEYFVDDVPADPSTIQRLESSPRQALVAESRPALLATTGIKTQDIPKEILGYGSCGEY